MPASRLPRARSLRAAISHLRDYLVYLAVRWVVCVVEAMPPHYLETLAKALGVVFADGLRIRRRVVHDNLRRAFPGISDARRRQIARAMWEHLVMMMFEFVLAPRKIHEENWRDYVTIDGKHDTVRLMLREGPVVVVSGHYGNFEFAGTIAGLLGIPTYAIARPLDNRFLHNYIRSIRERRGQYLLDKDGSAPEIDRLLSRGATLALLADQHAGPKGVWVDFFGHPTSCHKALAIFTLVQKAPMLVCYVRRRGRRLLQFELGLEDSVDPVSMPPELAGVMPLTRWYNAALERVIRQAPDQYWWLHRRWKGEPPARARTQARRGSASPATETESTESESVAVQARAA